MCPIIPFSQKLRLLISTLGLFLFLFIFTLNVCGSNEIDSLQKVFSQNLKADARIKTLFALGKAYYNESEYRNALDTDRKLIELINKSGTKEDSATAFRQIGLVMMEMSWYDESLKYLMQAQQLFKEAGNLSKQANCLMNIGIVHDYLGNQPMSLFYYNQSLSYFMKIKDESGIANCKLNMGNVLTKQKKFTEACNNYLAAAEIYARTNNLNYLAAAYLDLSLAYKNQKKFDQSMDYLKKSYAIYATKNDKYHFCFFHLNMGELLMQMNKPDEAKPHLDLAKSLAEEMEIMDLSARSYEFLSDYYVKKKNFELAYKTLLKSQEINNSILNAETVKKVSEIQYRYEIAKRESEKMQLVRDNLQNQLKLSQRTTLMYIMGILLLMIGIVVVLLLLWNRMKHKANIELEAKNKLIGSQKEELIKLNASKDKFLSILAHDIKNPLAAILGISDILITDYEKLSEAERKGFNQDIYTSATNLFEIVNTLLNWSISQNGLISHQPRNFNISALCENSLIKLNPIAKLKDISLLNETDPDTTVYADDNMIMSVIHNLVSNAIKYSHRGGQIVVRTGNHEGLREISVIDNGIGITPENQAKLFRYDQSFRSKGTTGENGTGIGLILCKDFVERNNGTIWVESEFNAGSAFKFTLPVAEE
jgi:signal transduction histidine kinase